MTKLPVQQLFYYSFRFNAFSIFEADYNKVNTAAYCGSQVLSRFLSDFSVLWLPHHTCTNQLDLAFSRFGLPRSAHRHRSGDPSSIEFDKNGHSHIIEQSSGSIAAVSFQDNDGTCLSILSRTTAVGAHDFSTIGSLVL